MNKGNAYIIIPVHNRKDTTLKCLDTLKQNTDLDKYHVIVVDDGSTDGTSKAIETLYPNVVILTGDGDLWWTGAMKKGMEYAYEQGADYFIWLNDDCSVGINSFNNLITFCQNNANSIIGCQIIDKQNPEIITFGGKVKKGMTYKIIHCLQGQILECELLSGNLVCIPKVVIEKIGYPTPDIVPHYGGDSLFLIRARKAGFKIFVDNRTPVYNLCGDSDISPQRWLLKEGKPTDIAKLFFNPHSLYSWRIWLALNQEEFGIIWGFFRFFLFYTIRFVIPILLITILRFAPLSFRKRLSIIKRQLFTYFVEI